MTITKSRIFPARAWIFEIAETNLLFLSPRDDIGQRPERMPGAIASLIVGAPEPDVLANGARETRAGRRDRRPSRPLAASSPTARLIVPRRRK